MKTLITILFLFLLVQISGQNVKGKDIVIGEEITLYSKILNEERQLYISLPQNYKRNIHSYPVIIVLDAEYLFDITRSIVNIKASRNEMPESIIVGIPNNTRKRYDMAMHLRFSDDRTFFGNADGKKIKDYLTFFEKELFTFLNENYRINNHKTIIGMSPTFGPVLEAFWDTPNLFNGYIVLAAELALKTSIGETVVEKILKSVQDKERSKSAIYIGKASDDLNRRPKEEALAYKSLNKELETTANPNINYTIEVLNNENHYGMSIAGIEHGLETIYPFKVWNIPYRDFWNSESPARELKKFYKKLSQDYDFEILPLEDSFYAAQNLMGTIRRLKRQNRIKELKEVLELGITYYPNSERIKQLLADYKISTD